MAMFCVKQDITWKEIEDRLILPFLDILDSDYTGDKAKVLESMGYGIRSEGNWGEYGLSKVAVNCYTIELGRRFPVYLMTGDLASLPNFTSGWYFGSDSLRSPLHKYRKPGAPAYEGEFP